MKSVIITLSKLALLLFFVGTCSAQVTFQTLIPANPPGGIGGSCSASTVAYLTPDGTLVTCVSGVWTAQSGGGGGGGGGGSSSYVVSGCGVQYTSGLTYTVGVCNYYIAGVHYATTALTNVTLDAADGTFPRIDAIIVNSSNVATKITGTAAATPAAPTVDPSTQLALTFAYVAAMATTPTGVSTTTIYDENTEWTSAVSSGVLNAGSTTNPYHLTKDIEGTAVTLNSYVTLTKPAAGTEDLSTYNALYCYVRSKGTWPTGNGGGNARRNLTFSWLASSVQVGYGVLLQSGVWGFDSSITTVYQLVGIPISNFGVGSTAVDTLKITATGASGTSTFGFYIDWCQLQRGAVPVPSSFGNVTWRGNWNSGTTYAVNDVVQYTTATTSGAYIAVTTNANQTPYNNPTYWIPWGLYGGFGTTTASSAVLRDSAGNGQVFATSFNTGFYSVDADGVTVTLGLSAGHLIYYGSGTTNTTTKLPAANTFTLAPTYRFVNNTTATITIQDNSANTLMTLPGKTEGALLATSISTAAGTWLSFVNGEIRAIGAQFDGGGSALTTAAVAYVVVRFGCTITGYSVWADTGTIDFDVWKIASGTALPTVSNTIISGSNYLALASNTVNISTSTSSLTTTTSTADDIYGFKIHAVSSATKAGVQLRCRATN